MTTHTRSLLLVPALAGLLLLAACTTTAPTAGDSSGDTGSDSDSAGSGSEGSGGVDCSAFSGEYAPFSSPAVLEAPAEGATWGDGSPYAFTVTPEAAAEVPQLSFLGLTSGSVVDASSAFLEEQDGNVFDASGSSLFNSDFDGQPGIARLTIISDLTFDGAEYDGTTIILGQYCVTFAAVE